MKRTRANGGDRTAQSGVARRVPAALGHRRSSARELRQIITVIGVPRRVIDVNGSTQEKAYRAADGGIRTGQAT